MAKQRILHGAFIDIPSTDEIVKLIPRPPVRTRIRASAVAVLDAAGSGLLDVYKVPTGQEFEVRRVQIEINGVEAGNFITASISLATVGPSLQYLRSGRRIEWAYPTSPLGSNVGRVPGIQTWGQEQGPYVRNGEVFQVLATALGGAAINSAMLIEVEGILMENRQNA